jgi:hypothetical protein
MAPAAYVGAAAAAGSLALNVSNSMGGSGVPQSYQLGNQPGQDLNFNNIQNLYGQYAMAQPGQVIPQFQQAQRNISNNPYAGLQQQGAGAVANLGAGVAGQQLSGANSLFGAGNQVLGQAFDPQQALYNRTQQQVMDQINAANAASGVSGPAAAGVAQQGISNFNIDWQNNLLNRERMGIQAGGQAFAGGADLGNLGLGTIASSSGMPYNTYLGQQQNIIGGLNSLNAGVLGAFALPQQELQNTEAYLGLGQSANNLALMGQQQNFNQGMMNGAGLANSSLAFANNPQIQSMFQSAGSGINSLFAPSNPNVTAGGSPTFAMGGAYDPSNFGGFDFSQAG